MTATAVATAPQTFAPYVGLVPFAEDDADFFFGRERERRIVAANLRAARLTILYGPSGVGKTSLLLAGVVSDLRAAARGRTGHGDERARFAIAYVRSWRDDPLAAMVEAVRAAVGEAPPQPGRAPTDVLAEWTTRVRTILVVIDQFEDYFLYHPDEEGDGTLAVELPRIVNDPELRVNILISIREDGLAKLDRFKGRIPHLFSNYLRIDHLDRESARSAVVGPVEEVNRRLSSDAEPFAVEPDLVEAVLDAAASSSLSADGNGAAPTTGRIETPILQLLLARLWDATIESGERTLTRSTLERLGGPERIVRTHLADALAGLGESEEAIAADVFRYLVTGSRTKIAHSSSDLAEWTGHPDAEVAPVLERLARGEFGRVLRPVPAQPGAETGLRYEIFHDVLAEPILEWRRSFEAERARAAETRRQRALLRRLALAAVVLLAVVLALVALTVWAFRERSHAGMAQRDAEERTQVARSQALAAGAVRELSFAPHVGLALAVEAAERQRTPLAEEALRRAVASFPARGILGPVGRLVYGAAFSPDGRLVATAGEGGARVWSASTGEEVTTLVARGTVDSAAFSHDGRFLVTAAQNGDVRVWGTDDWAEVAARRSLGGGARAAFTADDGAVVVTRMNGSGRVLPWRRGRLLAPIATVAGIVASDGDGRIVRGRPADEVRRAHAEFVDIGGAVDASVDGQVVVVAGPQRVRVWRRGERTPVLVMRAEGSSVALSRDGRRLVTVETIDGRVRVWPLPRGTPVTLTGAGEVANASFSRDGRTVATTGYSDGTVRVWDAATGEQLTAIRAAPPGEPPTLSVGTTFLPNVYTQAISGSGLAQSILPGYTGPGVAFAPDGGRIVTWGFSRGAARVWHPLPLRRLSSWRKGGVTAIDVTAIDPAAGAIMLIGPGNRARLLDVARGDEVRLRGRTGAVLAVALSRRGGIAAAGLADGTALAWDARTGSLLARVRPSRSWVGAVALSSDGRLLATGSKDGTARLWRLPGGGPAPGLARHGTAVTAVDFSDDGRVMLTGGLDGTVRLWETGSDAPFRVLGRHRPDAKSIIRAFFGPGRNLLATLHTDRVARVWRARRGQSDRPVLVERDVEDVALAPDGRYAATGGGDGFVRLHDLEDGSEAVLRGHAGVVFAVAFSRDGRLLASGGGDGTIRVWQTATGGNVAAASLGLESLDTVGFAAGGTLAASSSFARLQVLACEPCLPVDELLALARDRLDRALTPDERAEVRAVRER